MISPLIILPQLLTCRRRHTHIYSHTVVNTVINDRKSSL